MLASEVKNLGTVKAITPELPPVVPIISLKEPSSYDFNSMPIDVLIVMFEDFFDEEIRSKVEEAGDIHSYLNFDGKVLASSIMPDDIITQEEAFYYFLGTVDKLKFDGAIAWDSPVYVDIPLYDSWVNLLMGLKLTHEVADWGMPVYGLAKGNVDNQIRFSTETLARIGITSMALHASEYMMVRKEDSTVMQILYTYFGYLPKYAQTVFWEIHFNSPELIDLIHDEYDMLPGTWKARRFENLYETYVKYRGKKLTDEEILEIRNIKEENPPKVSAEWISEKVRELFPSIEWGGDLERIKRMLGRKKSK